MQWSTREFGRDAAERYDALVTQALEDIGAEPARPGSQARPDLGPGIFVYHVRFSRERARSARGIVRRPRHFVIYRVGNRVVDVLRVLHDSRELRRHLPSG